MPFFNLRILAMVVVLTTAACAIARGQSTTIDGFESPDGWKIVTAEGVTLSVSIEEGVTGKCLRLDYDFVTGAGYALIQRDVQLKLPKDYEFAFQVRGDGPENNLEFKLVDAAGDSVWWVNRRAFQWPQHWTRLANKKRLLEFAWGPSGGVELKEVSRIEFAIASSRGGKGTVWLDELTFREIPTNRAGTAKIEPAASSASPGHPAGNATDGDPASTWRSATDSSPAVLTINLGEFREIGGLEILWDAAGTPQDYDLEASLDGSAWFGLGSRRRVVSDVTVIVTPQLEATALRFTLRGSGNAPVGVREITLKGEEFSRTPNFVFSTLAAERPRGRYPKYFLSEQSYWTIIGASGDDAESLMNEEGAVEVARRGFTLEPFVTLNGALLTWDDGEHRQSLEKGYLPIPTVVRRYPGLELSTTAFVDGDGAHSVLHVEYDLQNTGIAQQSGTLHIAVRPFQVNPPWQRLAFEGGVSPIHSMQVVTNPPYRTLRVNNTWNVTALDTPTSLGVTPFGAGDIVEFLTQGHPPGDLSAEDPNGLVSGVMSFAFSLEKGAQASHAFLVPLHPAAAAPAPIPPTTPAAAWNIERHAAIANSWEHAVSNITLTVPHDDQWLADTFKSQLAYILINRDGPAIQPGSRSYKRSWARDGSMTSASLLACGHFEEVKAWIDWFGSKQFASGKVPCVVDSRGPDPVSEHDSTGEYIWAVSNYYRFTHDAESLRLHWPRVQLGMAYLQSLRGQCMTPEFLQEGAPQRAFYGLMPESISHEGYSAKPMHSYWDDFFTLLGFKEAAYLAGEVGDPQSQAAYSSAVANFRGCLYESIVRVMREQHITFIPGCAELGDFDATSTAVALFPCDELEHAPGPALHATFDKYWEFFQARAKGAAPWEAFTPYELRNVGAFVRLGERERAYELLEWFHQFQRPQGWNHWAEVVWHDPKTPKFLGDMPHTWVGSDFLNSICSMFAYTSADSLITFAGIPRPWIDTGEPIAVRGLVTPYGVFNGSITRTGTSVHVEIGAGLEVPPAGIVVKAPAGSGAADSIVRSLPADLIFQLSDTGR